MRCTAASGCATLWRMMGGPLSRCFALGSMVFLLLACHFSQWCNAEESPRARNLRLRTCAVPTAAPIRPLPPTTERELYRDRPVSELSTDIRPPAGQLPEDVESTPLPPLDTYFHGPATARNWSGSQCCWEAACLQHQPLYFEDINLERHGHRVPLIQPAVSAAHFFGRIPALPYLTALDSPYQREYVLGHGRPGTCEPYPIRLVPVELGPTLVQAAVVTGLIFALP